MAPSTSRSWIAIAVSVRWVLKRNTKREHYEFNRLPFCLSNSPAYFQRLMDAVLKDWMGTECWVFIDDIVYSKSAEEHAARLENVLSRFDEANLQLHPGKSVCLTTGAILWHRPIGERVYGFTRKGEVSQSIPNTQMRQGC